MAITLENWNNISARMLAGEIEEAELSSVLSGLTDDITDTLGTEEHLRNENEQLQKQVAELKEANYNLFIRQGKMLEDFKKQDEDDKKTNPDIRASTIKIDDLFREDK